MFQSLALQTDQIAMRGRSTFEDKGAYVVQRTLDEPNFWFGNQLIYPQIRPREEMLGAFAKEFPDARHVTLSFDQPGIEVPDWVRDDPEFQSDICDTLALQGPISGPDLPTGLTLRKIASAQDWADVVSLQTEIGVEQGYDGENHAPFVRARFAAVRARSEAEAGTAWFGVYDGDLLVADMGLVWTNALARYQNVETRRSHRRRGICAALLVAVHAYGAQQAPDARFVIVADTDEPPGRVYRRSGFELVETTVAVFKPSY